ncbi:hypothetical protein Pla52o_06680 [Novipirellula galeiformis]|uniref:Uncharacterized protein n=1 Tax=Novipirellula galeiformis TaxID=2528004 RepID=A0A5C6CP99_9BACT|nr:hypothetical protein [Novipirellula galeiformis]TWU26813.1 hypothetical protein Pla52o_06680 [Novipirellula galeiformis]
MSAAPNPPSNPRDPRGRIANPSLLGCAATLGSVAVTCVLLFFNASFVMALLTAAESNFPAWAKKPEASQFILFMAPLLLVVIQWMIIDYARSRFRR